MADAEVEVHGGADRPGASPGRCGRRSVRPVPEAGDQRADLLRLEEEVCRNGRGRDAPGEAARGREPAAEGPGRRSHPRQAHAPGGAPKKVLRPAALRERARWMMATFNVSAQRACRAIRLGRSTFYW